MIPRVLIPGAFALVLAACGGSKQPAEPAPSTAPTTAPAEPAEPAGELSPEDKLRMQQAGACRAMCERLTACSVEDARAKLSEEELAELDLENTSRLHTEQCDRGCNASALSPRQVQVIRDCVTADSDCKTFVSCLEAVSQGG